MRYSDLENFKNAVRETEPSALVSRWLTDRNPYAFPIASDLEDFEETIRADYPDTEEIIIAGTSNWQYSLNPQKNFSEYHEKSDVDVVLISPNDFDETWEIIRELHRNKWYAWGKSLRDSVMRTGQNIYCGFVSPKHIPDRTNDYRFRFLQRCNSYSVSCIQYREVNLMFFKNIDDVIDYYIRGVRIARSKI